MINMVFLLLIFFLMAARIAPPPPFDITLPSAAGETPLGEGAILFAAADGTLSFAGQSGVASLAALKAQAPERLSLRADAAFPAPELAALLADLAALGVTSVDLAIRTP